MDHVTVSCYCKKIKFTIGMSIKWIGHCHCKQCQQIHGSAFVTWVGFKTKNFKLVDPENYFKTYDSGIADRGFCLNCGSSFYLKYNSKCKISYWRNAIFFTMSNIENKIDLKPSEHIFYNYHVSWFDVNDNLPKKIKKNN